jgi:antitoxin (DNA-binding transcriptional repressor) of toxin-antitoxin stability system
MKVKVGELKTQLSKYLRKLEIDGEPIEICIRETPVAYMTAVGSPNRDREAQRLEALGIRVTQWGTDGRVEIAPPTASESSTVSFNSVESMRGERNW